MNKRKELRVRVEMGEREGGKGGRRKKGESTEKRRSKALADDVRPVWLRCQWVSKGTGQREKVGRKGWIVVLRRQGERKRR